MYSPDASAAVVDTVTNREGGKSKKCQGPKTEIDPIEVLKAKVLEMKKLCYSGGHENQRKGKI